MKDVKISYTFLYDGITKKIFNIGEVIDFIKYRYPDVMPKVSRQTLAESLSDYFTSKKLRAVIYDYDIKFALALLKYFEYREEYEICAKLLDAIQEHNYCTNDNLPLSL